MNRSSKFAARPILLAGAMLMAATLAFGQPRAGFPEKPVRLIVPFPPGGGTDVVARQIAPRLGAALGGPSLVVENRGGAAGTIGTDAVSKAPPDGHTLGLMDTGFAINPSLVPKLPYDPVAGFTVIAVVATSPVVLVATPGLGVSTYKELIEMARKRPGKITFASAGSGSINHLAGEMLKQQEKISLLHIPYRGGGPALTDVIGGQVDLIFASPSVVQPQVASGRLVAIASTGSTRVATMDKVPTVLEISGQPLDASAFYTLVAPAGLAPDMVKRLTDATASLARDDALQRQMREMGFELELKLGAEAEAYVARQRTRWGAVVKASGAKLD